MLRNVGVFVSTCLVFCALHAVPRPVIASEKTAADNAQPTLLTKIHEGDREDIRFSGYIEGYYQWNFGDPSNGITDFRAFDSRHNAMMLLNASIATDWRARHGYGRLALQFGSTADTYYSGELSDSGSAGTGAHRADVFKSIQEAYAGTALGTKSPIKIEAGIFLSPIGPENIAIKDQWTLSRSNLFYAFPYYHLGARAHIPLGGATTLTLSAFNGWDSILDKNDQKTINVAIHHAFSATMELDAQYFVGVERPRDAAEGAPLRHLLDVWVKLTPHPRFSIILDVDAGFEAGDLGTSWWVSGGVWTRTMLRTNLFLATQSDYLRETPGEQDGKVASRIFFPVAWVSSHAVCIERRFGEFAAVKLEFRYDLAADNLYFRDSVTTDLTNGAYLANTDNQQTLTLAITSWF